MATVEDPSAKSSAQRRWDQRRFTLEESVHTTGGARTVFVEHMTPGTTVPPHYHTRFSETFDLISGSMSVYSIDPSTLDKTKLDTSGADLEAMEATAQPVIIGQPLTVPPGYHHQYRVGTESSTLRCIIEPADADFERLLMILNGLAADGELEALGDSVVLMATVMDLSDAYMLGPAKDMLDGVRRDKAVEVKELKDKLLAKYDNKENLEALMANEMN